MTFLAAGGEIDPLGHVLDRPLVSTAHGTPIITMHMLTLVAAALLLVWIMSLAAKAIATGPESDGNNRYVTRGRIGQLVEVIAMFLRDQTLRPVLGKDTDRFLPYLLTLFFFILINNLLGLVPLLDIQHLIGTFAPESWHLDSHWAVFGGTATANIAVTGGLAFIAFIVIQVHSLRSLGLGGTMHHLLGGAPVWLAPIMVPVELASLFIKPVALAIRLFANMVAGHTLLSVLALFGFMAYQGVGIWLSGGVTLVSGVFSILITFLELFIAFLQAYIFMFLTAVFIAQMSHHDDAELEEQIERLNTGTHHGAEAHLGEAAAVA